MGESVVRCLMFADDVILMSSTAKGLQRSFDVAGEFAKVWRFKYNLGVDKTAVMVFGGVREGESWCVSGNVIPVVQSYRYLGVRLVSGAGKLRGRRSELLRKASGAFWRAWGLGMRGGWLSAAGAKGLWEALVRPVLEYGAEVDSGKWEEAEVLQRRAGRMCLGVGQEVPNAAVMGELGWWSMRGRREYLRLVYWGKVVKAGGVVREVYEEGRRRVDRGEARAGEWCVETKRLLEQVGLGDVWVKGEVGVGWKALVRGLVQVREELAWKGEMLTKSTLARYMRVKESLKPTQFLGASRFWVRQWVRLRAGASCLEVDAGRRRGGKGVFRDERLCKWCKSGVVEDAEHFLEECRGWVGERKRLWEELRGRDARTARMVSGLSREERVDWLCGGGNPRTRDIVIRAVGEWMCRRARLGRDGDIVRLRKEAKERGRRTREELEVLGCEGKVFGAAEGLDPVVALFDYAEKEATKAVDDLLRKKAEAAGGRRREAVELVEEAVSTARRRYDYGMGVGDMIYTKWGQSAVSKVHEDGDVECEWEGYDGVFTMTVPEVRVGDRVKTKWGDAKVSVVYEDGDVGCIWKGWEGVFTVGRNDVWVMEE